MKNLVVLMLVIVMYFGSNVAGLNFDQDCPKCMLEIVNELGPGRSLQYHCHSKNDNLNVNVLEFKANKKLYSGSIIQKDDMALCLEARFVDEVSTRLFSI